MVPKHLVSHSSGNNTNRSPIHDHNIDPSFTRLVASETDGIGSLGAFEDQHRSQLNRKILERHKGQDEYEFDWSVKRAMDSGYDSGNLHEPQERDTSFPQAPSVSLAQPLLRPEDT